MSATELPEEAHALNEGHGMDFSDLRALYINCTLTRSPGESHTQLLMDRSIAICEANGVTVDTIRAVDHDIATGVYPDMTEYGWESDEWPGTFATWNLLHAARMLKDLGGIPVHGNQRDKWAAGCRFDYPNPEHRA